MSFDKNYPKRKDHRKQYHDSRQFDRSCRAHGGCPYCEGSRQISKKRIKQAIKLSEIEGR